MKEFEVMDRIVTAYTKFLGCPCTLTVVRNADTFRNTYSIEAEGVEIIKTDELTPLLDQLKGQAVFV